MIDFFHYYYFPSHTRAATYIVGLTLGYIMFEKKKTKVIIPPVSFEKINAYIRGCPWLDGLL